MNTKVDLVKFFLFTSDKYVDIVADHAKLFNMMSKGREIEVTVLGFQPPTVQYPANFKFQSMGSQEDFPPKIWSEPIRKFIEGVEEKYFCYTFYLFFLKNCKDCTNVQLPQKGSKLQHY